MSDPVDLQATIETAAQAPASATSDGQSVTQQDLAKLIEADRYLAQKAAAGKAKNPAGIRITQLIPPGSV